VDPHSVTSFEDCLELVDSVAGDYPQCLGWQLCMETVLPVLPDVVRVEGRELRRCIAFLVDEDLGPHFVFDDGGILAEVLVSEITFGQPLSALARLWIRSFEEWRNCRTHQRRKPLRMISPSP
jgi:hypothetical protein